MKTGLPRSATGPFQLSPSHPLMDRLRLRRRRWVRGWRWVWRWDRVRGWGRVRGWRWRRGVGGDGRSECVIFRLETVAQRLQCSRVGARCGNAVSNAVDERDGALDDTGIGRNGCGEIV